MFGVQYINLFIITCKVERKKRERKEDYKIADVMSKEVCLQFCLIFMTPIKCRCILITNVDYSLFKEILSKAKKPKMEEVKFYALLHCKICIIKHCSNSKAQIIPKLVFMHMCTQSNTHNIILHLIACCAQRQAVNIRAAPD